MRKSMPLLFAILIIFSFLSVQSVAQQAGKQVPIATPEEVGAPNALLYLPWDYNISNKKYPLILFGHGSGESTMSRLDKQGLPGNIAKGNPPYAIVSGDTVRFIVLSITGQTTLSEKAMSDGAKDLMKRGIRIDPNRIYVTGLSAGARATVNYIPFQKKEKLQPVSAVVPMSYPGTMWQMDHNIPDFEVFSGKGLWAISGKNDSRTTASEALIDSLDTYLPGTAKLTVYPGGHCCWMTYYDPQYREKVNGEKMNIYEWMLQYSLDGTQQAPVVNQPPLADVGNDMTVQLPKDSVLIDGSSSAPSDPNGKILAYEWSQKAGPTQAVLEHPEKAKTKVNALQAGRYVFTLSVTDNNGEEASTDLTVDVKKPKKEEKLEKEERPELELEEVVLPNPVESLEQKPENNKLNSVSSNNGVVADAGQDATIYFPINNIFLDGGNSQTNNGILYRWEKVSGPSSFLIKNPTRALTEVRDLLPGKYVFKLTVTDYGKRSATDEITVTVAPDPMQPGDVPYTANTKVPPYTGVFRYGTNPSSYGNGWDDIKIATIAEKAGVHSLRLPLPGQFVNHYGYDVRLKEFDAYTHQLGMNELTLFVGRPGGEQVDRTTYPPATKHSAVFADLYTPIWDNGENGTPINDDNQFALYIYNLVKRYGEKVKFWEIVNEPDMTGFWQNDDKGREGNWYDNPPSPGSLPNLRAPIFHYIRMLRVAYEVVKKYYPDSYIAPGGIGYPAFLDVLLRYTDNPDQGKVTAEYPLTGGAYFDVISFHTYPGYAFQKWDNAIGGFRWDRYSDRAADAIIDLKNEFDSIQVSRGYNDVKYPKKHFILTETNLPRKTFGTYYGTNELQRNFIIKALIQSQKHDIEQFYLYHIGETGDYNTAPTAYDLMGLYENLKRDQYGQEKLTDEGKAFKTTSMLLYGWKYDPARTAQLNLPNTIEGAAFKKGNKFRYVLWARTHTDKSEEAQATYSFPGTVGSLDLYRYEWDFSTDSEAMSKVTSQQIVLTGAPSFFTTEKLADSDTTNQSPIADAGKNKTLTLPENSISLNGTKSYDPDGIIASYKWSKKSGPSAFKIENTDIASTKVSGLEQGRYVFTLTVTDNEGVQASNDVTITVKSAPSHDIQPVANAGSNLTVHLPDNVVTLDGSGSKGDITSWRWDKKSGPQGASIHENYKAKTTVTGLREGTYVFTLTVSGETGWPSSGKVKVVVKGKEEGDDNETPTDPDGGGTGQPIANAGSNQTIILPANAVTLDGTASKGGITSWRWDKRSGPGGVSIHQNYEAKTQATGLREGTYVFTLTVSGETGWPSSSKVKVVVKGKEEGDDNETPSEPDGGGTGQPIANAGSNRTITLPANTVTLDGTASKGGITSWRWDKRSGPSGVSIHQNYKAKTQVTGLREGTYIFTLTVSGETGWPSSSKVKVAVTNPYTRKASDGNNTEVKQTKTLVSPKLDGKIAPEDPLANKLRFKVYPNPVHDQLNVDVKHADDKKLNLRIVDINGRVVKSYYLGEQVKDFNHSFDVSDLTNGIYFVQLIEEGKWNAVRKIIKY